MAPRGVTGSTVTVKGLSELIRDFHRVNRDLAREVRREMLAIGKIVADEAKEQQVPEQDLAAGQSGADNVSNTGRLQKGIRPRMRGATTIVENRTKGRNGYKYPGIFEYGVSGRARARRPFLVPALDEKQGEVIEALEDMLDRLTSANGFGRGGIL
jgi:HK97 gp10 family phage protein